MTDLDAKIQESLEIIDSTVQEECIDAGKELVAKIALFSGGNDSIVMLHLVRNQITAAGHCNTTIGIEETREFVRNTCKTWNIPLIEKYPEVTYEELVCGKVKAKSKDRNSSIHTSIGIQSSRIS